MELDRDNIARLREIVEGSPRTMTIVSHTNPDGDAIGSSLAWAAFLGRYGHTVECVVPNRYPYFLEWMPRIPSLRIFKDDKNGDTARHIAASEVIFCLDFNCIERLEGLTDTIKANEKALTVLIDHHLDPPEGFGLYFSYPNCSSTSFLIYQIIEALGGGETIDRETGEELFVGMMTDTGNFSFSYLTSDLFETIAKLVRQGLDIPRVHSMVYNSFTVDRVKLLGFALNKMETLTAGGVGVAYITLRESDLRRFNFQQGDSEGFVNYPLTVKDLTMSVIFIETRNFIRVSLRSRGEVDVSRFARLYFDGGGHRNASGGKSYRTMAETVSYFRKCVEEYFGPERR